MTGGAPKPCELMQNWTPQQYSRSGVVWEICPVMSCAEGKQVVTCSTAQLSDVPDQNPVYCHINGLYRDAQDRLLWRDKSCPTRT